MPALGTPYSGLSTTIIVFFEYKPSISTSKYAKI